MRICSGSASASTCWSAQTLIDATVGSGCAATGGRAEQASSHEGAHAVRYSRRSADDFGHSSNSVGAWSRSGTKKTERGAKHF